MAFARGVDHLDGDERSIPELVVPRPNASFIYRVKDDLLAESDGIRRGDLLIVERGRSLQDGRLALVVTAGHGTIVRVTRMNGRFTYDGMEEGSDVELFGIVSRVLRLLLP
ncbi:MAG TPA: S24 family peptidase [Thermoanaerobaculia bacterium]|jgi:SOS-response transcriptional repressor LexA